MARKLQILGKMGAVQTVNGISPDEKGNVALDIPAPTEDDALDLLMELDLVQPVTDENGAIYTDENGNILVL